MGRELVWRGGQNNDKRDAVDIRNATLLRGGSRTLGAVIVMSALTVGIAQAQNPITGPSGSSRSGIQTVITQKRDELQRPIGASRQRSQHQQRAAKNPDVHSSDR
jgi:hypothetical protein